MIPHITSTANPKLKWVKSLHKNSTRKEEGVFFVEGLKEISFAIGGGYLPHSLYICPEILSGESPTLPGTNIYTLNKECYQKIAYREGTEGVLAVFHAMHRTLDELALGENSLLLIAEAVEKPGNLGAILRTADGSGADAVIVCDPKVDVFNPNVIRASLGTVFTKQVVVAPSVVVYDFLQKRDITAYGALLSSSSSVYTAKNYSTSSAFVLGTEHDGLSEFWKDRCEPVQIPMLGENDSLNVSVAAAVLAYEAVRQREL